MIELQTERYERTFAIFREYKDVIKSVTLSGVADDFTWLDNFVVKNVT
jgi:endo-1,4-beta-xylanase